MTTAETSSEPFRLLAISLRESDFTTYASRLEDVLNGTWTTSSELIAELGSVVLEIRRDCSPLSSAQKRLIKDCLYQVRRVWPGFGLLQSVLPRWLL